MIRLLRLLVIAALVAGLVACAGPAAPVTQPQDETAAEEPTATPVAAAAEAQPAAESGEGEAAAGESSEGESALSGLRTFVIVPEESRASYIVDEEFFGGALAKYGIPSGIQDTIGSTQAIEGQFELNFDDLASALGENRFTVDLSTLSSDQRLRDNWIRENGPTFNQYPEAIFVAERLENAPTEYTEGEEVSFQLIGPLTIRDETVETTWEVTATLQGDTITGVAVANLKMTDFGITPPDFANTLTVADDFQARVEFTAREQ
ncbi:MAG TPA: YceI family protein [Caldilineaceae bacterium]|nr:YceI family protein [Caldilineaceae bacterium]